MSGTWGGTGRGTGGGGTARGAGGGSSGGVAWLLVSSALPF